MDFSVQLRRALEHHQAGRLAEALQGYEAVIAIAPRDSNAHHLSGVIYRDKGELEVAIRAITAAIVLSPNEASYFNNLGTCYLRKREYVAAEMLFRRALSLQPQYADALSNLGSVLRELLRLDEAERTLKEAISIAPNHPEAICLLGNVYVRQRRSKEALAIYEDALLRMPNLALAVKGKADALFDLQRFEESIAWSDRAALLDTDMIPELMQVKGQALEVLGKNKEAAAAFDAGLKASPGSIELAFMRSQVEKVTKDSKFFEYIRRYEQPMQSLKGMLKARVGYALGKAYEDVGDFAQASHFYAAGAVGAREEKAYDEVVPTRTNAILKQVCTPAYLDSLAGAAKGSEQIIFILGMPRSGTTLTEQILASHPGVLASGELAFAQEVLDRLTLPPNFILDLERTPDMPSTTTLAERGDMYLEKIRALNAGKDGRFMTDKLPGNFQLMGLIARMLPNAKIIHCRRDPIDTCISCYTKLFSNGQHWTFDFGEIGRFYKRYWDIMDHWRTVMPGRFLEVRYEQLVDDTEAGARKLLEWCELDWDSDVLQFHKTKRPVTTSSVNQVRQPIYKTAKGRWKKWEPYIQPLLNEIGDIEKAYWDELAIEADKQ
jgi:Tfp pilus assembly protein PilF